MVDHDLLVLGDVGVQLQGAHAEAQSLAEALQGLLGGQAEAATVGLQVETSLLGRYVVVVVLGRGRLGGRRKGEHGQDG